MRRRQPIINACRPPLRSASILALPQSPSLLTLYHQPSVLDKHPEERARGRPPRRPRTERWVSDSDFPRERQVLLLTRRRGASRVRAIWISGRLTRCWMTKRPKSKRTRIRPSTTRPHLPLSLARDPEPPGHLRPTHFSRHLTSSRPLCPTTPLLRLPVAPGPEQRLSLPRRHTISTSTIILSTPSPKVRATPNHLIPILLRRTTSPSPLFPSLSSPPPLVRRRELLLPRPSASGGTRPGRRREERQADLLR